MPKPVVGDPNPCSQQTGQSFKVKGDAEYEGPAEERVTVVDDVVGAGEVAADGMLLTVSYTGTLEDTGAEFDSAKVRHVWHACRGHAMRFIGPPSPLCEKRNTGCGITLVYCLRRLPNHSSLCSRQII